MELSVWEPLADCCMISCVFLCKTLLTFCIWRSIILLHTLYSSLWLWRHREHRRIWKWKRPGMQAACSWTAKGKRRKKSIGSTNFSRGKKKKETVNRIIKHLGMNGIYQKKVLEIFWLKSESEVFHRGYKEKRQRRFELTARVDRNFSTILYPAISVFRFWKQVNTSSQGNLWAVLCKTC